MSTDTTGDWMDVAIADLEVRKAKIEAMITNIRELQTQGTPSAGPSGPLTVKDILNEQIARKLA